MKLKINQKALSSVLSMLVRSVPNKSPMAIHSCFCLSVEGDGNVTIKVSSVEYSVQATAKAVEVTECGATCVDAKKLTALVKSLRGDFSVTADEKRMVIITETGEYELPSTDPSLFSDYNVNECNYTLILSVEEMMRGVSSALTCVSSDDLRPQLNGVFFDINEDGMNFVGTNGHALVVTKSGLCSENEKHSFIMPSNIASMAIPFFAKCDAVKVSVGENSAVIESVHEDAVKLSFRLVEGRYPNYNSVIPKEPPHTAKVERTALLDILGRMRMSMPSNMLVRLAFAYRLEVSVNDKDFSTSAKDVMPCEFDGEVTIGMNGDSLEKMLSNISTEYVLFGITSPSHAVTIRPESGNDMVELIMPMMVE